MICAICLESFNSPNSDLALGEAGDVMEGKIRLICNHIFHLACLQEEFKHRQICPLDRISFGDRVIEKISREETLINKILNVVSQMFRIEIWGEIALRGLPPMP